MSNLNLPGGQLPHARGWESCANVEAAEPKKNRLPIIAAFCVALLAHVGGLALLVTQVTKRELTMEQAASVSAVRVSLVAIPPPPPVVIQPPVEEAPAPPTPAMLTSDASARTIEQEPPKPKPVEKPREVKPVPKPKPVTKPVPKKPVPVVEQKSVEPTPPSEAKPDPASTQAQAAPVAPKMMDLPTAAPKDVPSVGCRVPAPAYPRRAKRLHAEGQVLVRLEINPKGLVQRADVVRSSGNEELDESAVAAVRGAVCNPYVEGGQAISVRAVQTVDFRLSN
ncbi:TonB family protein [Pseudomonas kitaguniensis]|uniref:energy transducer TonB n=1 Tax=Pseudomonas kitaguniensis TaxID=2607908 RepID=UPI003D02D59B